MRALRNWALPLVPEAWNQKNGIVTLRELRALRGEKTENVYQEAVEIITNICTTKNTKQHEEKN